MCYGWAGVGTMLLAILLSYFFVDQALVDFLVAHHTHDVLLLKIVANDTVVLLCFLMMSYFLYVLYMLVRNNILSEKEKGLLHTCVAAACAVFMKDNLKWLFSRYWPDTFFCQNLSWVHDRVYGFHWFSGSALNAAFPSGHATLASAVGVGLAFTFPRYRYLWFLLAAIVMLAQVLVYYHFLSDVLAGALLGGIVAVIAQYRRHPKGEGSRHLA